MKERRALVYEERRIEKFLSRGNWLCPVSAAKAKNSLCGKRTSRIREIQDGSADQGDPSFFIHAWLCAQCRPFFKADALPHPLHASGGQTFPRPAATRLAAVFIERQKVSAILTRPRAGEGARFKIAGHTPARRVGTAGTFSLKGREQTATLFPTDFLTVSRF